MNLTARETERKRAVAAKVQAALGGIGAELEKRKIKYKTATFGLSVRMFATRAKTSVTIELREERSGHTWHRTGSGKIRIQVGSYGNRRQFPERKAGFDFVAIADEVEAQLIAEAKRNAQAQADAAALARVEVERQRVAERFGDVRGSFISTRKDGIRIELWGLSEEQAIEIMQAAKRAIGIHKWSDTK